MHTQSRDSRAISVNCFSGFDSIAELTNSLVSICSLESRILESTMIPFHTAEQKTTKLPITVQRRVLESTSDGYYS